jgi:glycosyltransferase XagB
VTFGAPAASASTEPPLYAAPDDFPELDCVRGLLAEHVVETAAARAAALGIGADRVLIANNAIDEEIYLRALAERLDAVFEPLDGVPRAMCPLEDERLIDSVTQGMLPLLIAEELCLVAAPRASAARRIAVMIKDNPAQARHFRFTTQERLNRFALRCAGKTIAVRASEGLKQRWPALSAAPPRWRGNIVPVTIAGLVALAAAMLATTATLYALEIMLAAVFLAWLGLRLAGRLADWSAVDRLLDPDNVSATIDTLQRAARIVGRDLRMRLV